MINAKLSGAARTLVLTLRARAEEQNQTEPLLHDSWSADWYQYMPEYGDYDEWYNPAFQLATVIRSRLIDDAVTAFIKSHDNPLIVELGAGLSTRYYRIGESASTWIELDLEEAIVVRSKVDVETDKHWFLPANIDDLTWLEKLPEVDSKNILFIAEATLMFAEASVIETFFNILNEHFSGSSLIFDVVNPTYMESVNEQFEALEAPLLWAVYPENLKQHGLNVLNTQYLLLEFSERWEAIDIEASQRSKERSAYVIEAIVG
jgi:O-methyltransferase involved in polyketide biosynthesis